MKRCFAWLLAIAMAAVLLAVPVAAEETEGMSFTKELVWKGSKNLLQTPGTFEAWVKFPQDTSGRGGVILSSYGDGAQKSISFEVFSGGAPRLYWVESGDSKFDWVFDTVNLYTGNWEHVAIVRNEAAGTMDCYLNGQLAESQSLGGSVGDLPLLAYCLGGDHRSDNGQYCKGRIRSAAIYGDARTAEELLADMTGYGTEDLLLHYAPDGTETETIADLSGNGRDLFASTRWFEEKEPVTDYAYSFMVIGDTQKVSYNDPNLFPYIYDYVVSNVSKKNVKFVMGLGDITEKSAPEEWQVARGSIRKMDGIVPYSIVRGNHDMATDFVSSFPMSDYADVVAGSYEDSMLNTYHTFEVGKVKYLVLCLDYGPTDDVLEWANGVVEQNPDRNVIITTHVYLYRDGTTLDAGDLYPPSDKNPNSNNGDHLWEKLVSKHENIVLVLSGHDPNSQIAMVQTPGEKGNIVTQMLIDGQSVDLQEGSSGFVTTFYFSEDGRDVTVEHYATLKNKFFLTENQFSFTLDLIEPVEEEVAETQPQADTQPQGNSDVLLYVCIGAAVLVAAAVVTVLLLKKKK